MQSCLRYYNLPINQSINWVTNESWAFILTLEPKYPKKKKEVCSMTNIERLSDWGIKISKNYDVEDFAHNRLIRFKYELIRHLKRKWEFSMVAILWTVHIHALPLSIRSLYTVGRRWAAKYIMYEILYILYPPFYLPFSFLWGSI